MSSPSPRRSDLARANARLALVAAAIFCGMVGMAFAAVPFYRAFCQATGFNGTVRTNLDLPAHAAKQTVTVRFDTNVNGIGWRFRPVQASQVARLGQAKLAFFVATNLEPVPVTGRAVYNILPETAGAYFSKLECFCFKNQTLAPGQTMEFPVVYFVDPRYASDRDRRERGQITLSYTFFRAVTGPGAPAAGANGAAALGGARGAGL
ncbi:MAG TPA: cytochrome c oxidase assembly protein [Caulobacteraceae bacterium]|nr:cytochrome c oxidase assembly protein [Caulobacteraceae bacterium]